MEIVPLGPGFTAELRGVTLAEIAADTPAYEDSQHDRRERQGRGSGSPACPAQQGEPALAH